MIKINVNIKELTELHETLVTTNNKIVAIENQIFTKLKKLTTMWDDPNTPVFMNQNNLDKTKIDDYNEQTNKVSNTILEFNNDLINIARRCGFEPTTFNYNSDNSKTLIDYCNSSYTIIKKAKTQLDSMDVPASFRYASALKSMNYKLMDICEELKKDIKDLNEVVGLTSAAYNKIKSSSRTELLVLKPMNYISNVQNVNLVSSKSKIDEALKSQNLGTNNSNIEYHEKDSEFTNNSVGQFTSGKKTEIEESDSNFVNAVNRTTVNSNSITIDETSNSFNNSEVNKIYTKKENNFEENNNFTNNESSKTTSTNNINIENENQNIVSEKNQTINSANNNFQKQNETFNNSEKSTSTNSANINITQTNNNLSTPNETNANTNNIDFNLNNNFNNNEKETEANNTYIDIN